MNNNFQFDEKAFKKLKKNRFDTFKIFIMQIKIFILEYQQICKLMILLRYQYKYFENILSQDKSFIKK